MSVNGRIKTRENHLVRLNEERDSLFTHKTNNKFVFELVKERVAVIDKEIAVVKEEINQLKRETPTPEGYKVVAVKVLDELFDCPLIVGNLYPAEKFGENKLKVETGNHVKTPAGHTPTVCIINRDNPKVELLFGHE